MIIRIIFYSSRLTYSELVSSESDLVRLLRAHAMHMTAITTTTRIITTSATTITPTLIPITAPVGRRDEVGGASVVVADVTKVVIVSSVVKEGHSGLVKSMISALQVSSM